MGQGSSGKKGKGVSGGVIQAGDNSASAAGMQRLQNMTDDEFENYVNSLRDQYWDNNYAYPALQGKDYYNANGTQAVIADFGLNDKPTVVAKGEVDKIAKQNGTPVLYRGISDGKNISSKDIANQMMNDPLNRIGGGYYGDGFYFSDRNTTADSYAFGGTVVKATLSPNAKVIDYDTVYRSDIRKNSSRTLQLLGASDNWGNDGESIVALKMGYNVIKMSGGENEYYYIVIDRSAMIVEEV